MGYFIILLNILCDCNSRGFNSSPSPTSIKVEQIALSHPVLYNICIIVWRPTILLYASLFQLHYYWITADSQLTSRASSFLYVRTDHDTIIFTSIYFIANRSADSTVVRDLIGTPLPWCGQIYNGLAYFSTVCSLINEVILHAQMRSILLLGSKIIDNGWFLGGSGALNHPQYYKSLWRVARWLIWI